MKKIRVLVREEKTQTGSALVAQCLEYDITAQGNSLDDVKQRFEAVIRRLFEIAAKKNEAPLAGIDAAPAMYWHQWSKLIGHNENMSTVRPNYPKGASAPKIALLTTA